MRCGVRRAVGHEAGRCEEKMRERERERNDAHIKERFKSLLPAPGWRRRRSGGGMLLFTVFR
jgi:hypothetical protein